MKIPNFPGNKKIVDKDGILTEEWSHTLQQVFNELQTRMSDEGHQVPAQSAANIALLNDPDRKGAFVYNEDTNKAMVNINGTLKEITTS